MDQRVGDDVQLDLVPEIVERVADDLQVGQGRRLAFPDDPQLARPAVIALRRPELVAEIVEAE